MCVVGEGHGSCPEQGFGVVHFSAFAPVLPVLVAADDGAVLTVVAQAVVIFELVEGLHVHGGEGFRPPVGRADVDAAVPVLVEVVEVGRLRFEPSDGGVIRRH